MRQRFAVPRWALPALALPLIITALGTTPATAAQQARIAINADTGHAPTAHATATTPANTPVPIAIALTPRNESALDSFVTQVENPKSPQYRHFLTTAQYNTQFAPAATSVDQIEQFLRANGLRPTGVSGNRQVVDATGTASQVDAAFGTTLRDYGGYYAADGTATMPANVAGLVRYVSGFTDRPLAAHAARPAGDGPNGGESPADLQTAYATTSNVSGSGETVGLAEYDAFNQSDIDNFTQNYNLPSLTPTVAAVDGGVSSPGSGQVEVTLDIDAVDVYAPKAAQVVYEAPNTDTAWTDEWAKIASDNKVDILSNSWLLGESCESQPIAPTHDDVNQMTSQGITVFSASGDWGGHGCDYNGDNSTVTVDYPASDPGVTGVGGTTLTTGSGGSYQSETVWNGGSSGNTRSGGGYSSIYATPSWQTSVNSTKNRSVPDVSDAADPNAGGLAINMNGGWETIGGTSEASPLWAGYLAEVDQKAGKRLGNINPTIYQLAGTSSTYAADFHDVTKGNNDTYNAGPGYDLATGWGSPIGDKLASDLAGGTPPPPTNDFSISNSPTSGTVTAGQSTTTTVTTKVTTGSAESITFSASGLPTGATATFNPTSVNGNGSSTLTIATTSTTPSGNYPITITGKDTDTSHTTSFALTVNGGPNNGGITDGGFETGDLTGWKSTGTVSVVSSPVHSGKYAAKVGAGNATLTQTFKAGTTKVSVWYDQVCSGQNPFGFSTVTLTDTTSNAQQNLAQAFCGQASGYVQASASLTSGHSYTITIQNQDFGFTGSSAVTYVDDAQ